MRSVLIGCFLLACLLPEVTRGEDNLARLKAQREWLAAQVAARTKDKKVADRYRAQLARMSPRQLERAVRSYQAAYAREKEIADRLASQTGRGKQRAQARSRQAAAARKARMQASRNYKPGFQPVIRRIPGGRQQPPNPRRGINLPTPNRPVFGYGMIPFAFKSVPGQRQTPSWYKKVRSR